MTIAYISTSNGLMSHFSGNNTCKSTIIYVNIKINKEIKLKTITMATNPPLKSAQNAPKKLGHSEFTKQHGSVWGYNKPLPETEIGSPRMDHLVKSAMQLQQLKKHLEKKPGTNRLKQGAAEAMRNIIKK